MGHHDSMRCARNLLLPFSLVPCLCFAAESSMDENALSTALESAFRISPVHWDKNISVVEICGVTSADDESVMQWPDSTGELLKLMDALKYEYDMRGFHCVVFTVDAKVPADSAPKMLNALMECVTVCDMLRIPLRLTVKNGEAWVEVAPTYPSGSSQHLIIDADGEVCLYAADDALLAPVQGVTDWKQQLAALEEQQSRVNILWKPEAGNLARFVEVLELCNSLNVDYSLMLSPL